MTRLAKAVPVAVTRQSKVVPVALTRLSETALEL